MEPKHHQIEKTNMFQTSMLGFHINFPGPYHEITMEWNFHWYHVEAAASQGFGPGKFQLTCLFWHLSGTGRAGHAAIFRTLKHSRLKEIILP